MNFQSSDISKWILVLIGALNFGWLVFKRIRATHIVCREVTKDSLIRITKAVGDKIAVKFDKHDVNHLAQLELEVTNQGVEVLKTFDLIVAFREGTKILQTVVKTNPEYTEFKVDPKEPTSNVVELPIPYLNPVRSHGQKLLITFTCDGDLGKVTVKGGGEGWVTKHKKKSDPIQIRRTTRVLGVLILVLIAVAVAFGTRLYRIYNSYSPKEREGFYKNYDELKRVDVLISVGQKGLEVKHDSLLAIDKKWLAYIDSWENALNKNMFCLVICLIFAFGIGGYTLHINSQDIYRYDTFGDPERKPRRKPSKPRSARKDTEKKPDGTGSGRGPGADNS